MSPRMPACWGSQRLQPCRRKPAVGARTAVHRLHDYSPTSSATGSHLWGKGRAMATPEQEIERWLQHYAPPDQLLDEARQTLLALYKEEVPDLEKTRLARHTPDIGPADIAEEIVVAFGVGWRRWPLGEEGCVELW